jgi:hypothetical protein
VRLGPRWDEPLVLWQALVGPASSGKSPAMAPMRALLAALDGERDDEAKGSLVGEASLGAVADAVAANPRGVVLWRDDPPTWLHGDAVRGPWLPAWSAQRVSFGQGKAQRRIDRFAVSLLLACQSAPSGRSFGGGPRVRIALAVHLARSARSLRARRLQAAARRRSAGRAAADCGRGAHARRSAGAWRRRAGARTFDEFLSALRAEIAQAEDLEMAWLGKGRGIVARLAGVLELLAWSTLGSSVPPGPLGRAPAAHAVRLWSDYFRPHARALFDHSVPGERERLARRVARWLRSRGLGEVSREQVRTEALTIASMPPRPSRSCIACRTPGWCSGCSTPRHCAAGPPTAGGSNPRLHTTLSAGNSGNSGKS